MKKRKRLVETDRLAHGGLDVERLDVLPILLEQGDQEVDSYKLRSIDRPHCMIYVSDSERTQHDVCKNLVLSHLDMADSDTQAEHLLELELDGRTDLSELVAQVLSVRDGGRELAGCVKH